jgi:putative transposase
MICLVRTAENRQRFNRDRLRYPSDMTDDAWSWVSPLIPFVIHSDGKRTVDLREVVNGFMSILGSGRQWRYTNRR